MYCLSLLSPFLSPLFLLKHINFLSHTRKQCSQFTQTCLLRSVWFHPSFIPSSLPPLVFLPRGCFSILSLPFMQNYSPFPTNLSGNTQNSLIVLPLKLYHTSLFPIIEKRYFLFFKAICVILKKRQIYQTPTERGERKEGEEGVTTEGDTYLLTVWLYMCMVKYSIRFWNCMKAHRATNHVLFTEPSSNGILAH